MSFSGEHISIELTQSHFKDENILSSDAQKFNFLSYEKTSSDSDGSYGL